MIFQDDLAENAVPSPVWMTYDPHWDLESEDTDCESFYCDEYYDEDGCNVQKKEKGTDTECGISEKCARVEPPKVKKRPNDITDMPSLKLPEQNYTSLEPTVIWRSRILGQNQTPVQETDNKGGGKKVSLLSDWRQRFNIRTRGPDLNQRQPQELNNEISIAAIPTGFNGALRHLEASSKISQLETDDNLLRRPTGKFDFSIHSISEPTDSTKEHQYSKPATKNDLVVYSDVTLGNAMGSCKLNTADAATTCE